MNSVGGEFVFNLLHTLQATLFNLLGMLIEYLHTPARILFTLYLLFFFYSLLTGKIRGGLSSFFTSFLVVVVVYQFAFDPEQFREWFYEPILGASLKLSAISLTGGADSSLAGMFTKIDEVFGRIFSAVDQVGEKASFWTGDIWVSIQIYLIGGAMALIFGALYAIFVILFIGGIIGIHILFVMFAVVGMLAAFPYTRHIFYSWLRGIFTYALIPVFTAIIMGITIQFLEGAAIALEGYDPQKAGGILNSEVAGQALLVGLASIYFHFKAPEYAATLTGGTSSGMSGLVAPLATVGGAAATRATAGAQILSVSGAAGARKLGRILGDSMRKATER